MVCFTSNGAVTEDGWYIDDVSVTAVLSSTYDGTEYQFHAGTSMAAAYVSGLAALARAHNPYLSMRKIKSFIINNVDEVPALSSMVASGGRVNAHKVLNNLYPDPCDSGFGCFISIVTYKPGARHDPGQGANHFSFYLACIVIMLLLCRLLSVSALNETL